MLYTIPDTNTLHPALILDFALQDVEWADYDSKGKPTGPIDLLCFQTIQMVMPTVGVEELMLARESKDPAAVSMWEEFQSARQVHSGEVARPLFQPTSDVASTSTHSLHVYRKIGLITESDLFRFSGCTPKMVKGQLTPVSLRLDGPKSQPTTLYPISLDQIPASELAGMIKAKISYDMSVSHAENMLRSQDQISQNQGATLFGLTAAGLNESKPLLKDAKVLTVSQLKDIKSKLDAEAAPPETNDESSDDANDVDEVVARPKGRARTFNLGSLASKAPKKIGRAHV